MEWGEYPTGEYIEAKGCYAVTIIGRRYKIHSYGDTVFSRQGWTAWHGADHVLSDIAHTMTPQGGCTSQAYSVYRLGKSMSMDIPLYGFNLSAIKGVENAKASLWLIGELWRELCYCIGGFNSLIPHKIKILFNY